MTTLPNMGLVLPTRGPAGSGTWDDTIDANLGALDAHDHTNGAGSRIPVAGLDIDADLSFGSLWAPINLHHITLASIATSTPLSTKSVFVGNDNELYFRNNAGNNVKITVGNALNVAAFIGGIGGDYTAVGAAVAFDDSQKRYTFKDGGANWARAVFGGVRLIDFGTTKSVFVGLIAPSALAASYTLTMPLTLPSAKAVMLVDNVGQISAGPTNGQFPHGVQTIIIPVRPPENAGIASSFLGLATPSLGFTVGIPIQVGKRIVAMRAVVSDSATGPTRLALRYFKAVAGSNFTVVLAGGNSAGTGAVQTLSLSIVDVFPNEIVASGTVYYVNITVTAGSATTCGVYAVEVDYDQL